MSTESSNLYNTKGIQISKDAFVVIVRTEWNAETADKLEEGCRKVLESHGVAFHVINVPGAFEIPFAVKAHWEKKKYLRGKPDAFITLGCVLRGDTPHFEFVCRAITDGVLQLNLSLPVPVVFGVLTVDSQQQIDERTGGKHGHKGEEAAITAIKMIAFNQSLK